MGEFSIWHLMIVLIIVLIFFGPGRLPGLGNSLGKAIRGFKEGIKGINDPAAHEEKPTQSVHESVENRILPGGKSKAETTTASEKSTKKDEA